MFNLSCGAQTLKDYLFFHKNKGIIPRGNISNFQEMIDEAKFYCTLFPQKTLNLARVSPCIVKFGVDHFVLVNGVSQGIVYYLDNGIPLQLPLDDFTLWWKGLVLSETIDDSAQILKEEECLKISGHKKFFKQILAPLLPMATMLIPGIGPMVSAALSAGISAGTQALTTGRVNPLQVGLSAVGGGLGKAAMAPGISAAKGVGGGWGSQVWQGGRTLLGMQPSIGAATTSPLIGMPAASGMGLAPSAQATFTGLGTAGASIADINTALMSGKGITYVAGQGWKAPVPTTSAAGYTTAAPAATAGAGSITQQLLGKGIQSYLPSLLAGGVSAGMTLPELPDLEANYREVSQRVLGGSPLSNLATNRAMAIMQGEPLTTEDEQAILNIFKDREEESIEQINKQYQTVGRLGSEEHQEQVRKGREYWNTQKAYGLYAARKDAQAYQNQILMGAWQYDQNQITQLIELASKTGDIEALRWSVRVGDTEGVKDTLDKLALLLWPQQATAPV